MQHGMVEYDQDDRKCVGTKSLLLNDFDAPWLKRRDPTLGETAPIPHGLKRQGPAGCHVTLSPIRGSVVEFGYGARTRVYYSVYPPKF